MQFMYDRQGRGIDLETVRGGCTAPEGSIRGVRVTIPVQVDSAARSETSWFIVVLH